MAEPVLVVRRAALGDFVLTLPVIRALTTIAPVFVVTHARYAPLLPPGATLHDDTWLWRGVPPPLPFARAFAFGDVAAEALRAVNLAVHAVAPRPAPGVHAVDHYAGVLTGVPLPEGAFVRAPRVDWAPAPGPAAVILAPGSGGATKRWPLDRWRRVADALGDRGVAARFVRGPDEADEPGWPPDAVCPDLPGLLGLAAGCRAWLGPDSGPSHLAAAVGAPGRVGVVFGPTDPATWAPVGARVWPWDTSPADLAAWAGASGFTHLD